MAFSTLVIIQQKHEGLNVENMYSKMFLVLYLVSQWTLWLNHRHVSILNSVLKLFEKLIQKQLNPFVNKKLSEYLCGYGKGNSTQYALLKLIESWKN